MPWFSFLFQISFRVILVHDSRISISNLQSPSCLTALSSSSEVKVRKYQFSFPEIETQWCPKQSRTLFNFLIFWAVASLSSKTLRPRFVSRHFLRYGQKMLSILWFGWCVVVNWADLSEPSNLLNLPQQLWFSCPSLDFFLITTFSELN